MTAEIRRATSGDFNEIARLVPALWGHLGLEVDDNDWRENAEVYFSKGLEDNSINSFVATNPDGPTEVVAYGIGVIYQVMPALWLPTGRMGYLQWFVTAENWRKQGLAEAIARRLIEWFEAEGVTRIQLHATKEGVSLYRKLGFEDTWFENLWLRM